MVLQVMVSIFGLCYSEAKRGWYIKLILINIKGGETPARKPFLFVAGIFKFHSLFVDQSHPLNSFLFLAWGRGWLLMLTAYLQAKTKCIAPSLVASVHSHFQDMVLQFLAKKWWKMTPWDKTSIFNEICYYHSNNLKKLHLFTRCSDFFLTDQSFRKTASRLFQSQTRFTFLHSSDKHMLLETEIFMLTKIIYKQATQGASEIFIKIPVTFKTPAKNL